MKSESITALLLFAPIAALIWVSYLVIMTVRA